MRYVKRYDNGLKLIVDKIDGLFSVSAGVLVKTGSSNESEAENGISHFIEHTVFKGTEKRSAFEISDYVDRIGAQINAFTSKELTCYYTKSTTEHLKDSLEVLSDIFFNAVFDAEELEKEKGVIIEEINMSEDSPEDLCLDLLASAYHGNEGLGRTILGPENNVKSFGKKDALSYMDKYYCADNVVVSLAGNVDKVQAEAFVKELFADKFKRVTSAPQKNTFSAQTKNLLKTKKTEQCHIAFAVPAYRAADERSDALAIANVVFGGGMSSRLFQSVRENLGLCYSIYSYCSGYKDEGVLEVYAGVNTENVNKAASAVMKEFEKMKKSGVTEQEFLRGKEQIKSSFIMGRESTATQMLLYGKYLLFLDKKLDFNKRIAEIDSVNIEDVNAVIKDVFDFDRVATALVGPKKKPLSV